MQAKEEADWPSVITGLGLPHVGYEAAKALAAKFPNAQALKDASVDSIMAIQRFGPNNAPAIVNALKSSRTVDLIDKLAALGLDGKKTPSSDSTQIATNSESAAQTTTVASEWHGKNWVFSGALDSMSRSDAGKKVEKYLGGAVKGTVSKGSILVTGGKAAEGATSKAKKALDIGATVLNETEFLELLRKHGVA